MIHDLLISLHAGVKLPWSDTLTGACFYEAHLLGKCDFQF